MPPLLKSRKLHPTWPGYPAAPATGPPRPWSGCPYLLLPWHLRSGNQLLPVNVGWWITITDQVGSRPATEPPALSAGPRADL
jgi:hypothetical protein